MSLSLGLSMSLSVCLYVKVEVCRAKETIRALQVGQDIDVLQARDQDHKVGRDMRGSLALQYLR